MHVFLVTSAGTVCPYLFDCPCTRALLYAYCLCYRVDCGAEFSVFSSCNGLLMTCGRGDMGSLGQGDWKDQHKPQLVQGLLNYDVLVVGCGENHVIVLMTDGSIFAWGLGQNGRLGLGNEENQ